jgi:hypothetical protein
MLVSHCALSYCGKRLESLNRTAQIIEILQHAEEHGDKIFFLTLKALSNEFGDYPKLPTTLQVFEPA